VTPTSSNRLLQHTVESAWWHVRSGLTGNGNRTLRGWMVKLAMTTCTTHLNPPVGLHQCDKFTDFHRPRLPSSMPAHKARWCKWFETMTSASDRRDRLTARLQPRRPHDLAGRRRLQAERELPTNLRCSFRRTKVSSAVCVRQRSIHAAYLTRFREGAAQHLV